MHYINQQQYSNMNLQLTVIYVYISTGCWPVCVVGFFGHPGGVRETLSNDIYDVDWERAIKQCWGIEEKIGLVAEY